MLKQKLQGELSEEKKKAEKNLQMLDFLQSIKRSIRQVAHMVSPQVESV